MRSFYISPLSSLAWSTWIQQMPYVFFYFLFFFHLQLRKNKTPQNNTMESPKFIVFINNTSFYFHLQYVTNKKPLGFCSPLKNSHILDYFSPPFYYLRNKKTCTVFLSSYRNKSGSLGERKMPWEHEPQASVSTAFSSSPKLLRAFLLFDSNTVNMFSISFRKHRDQKKENSLLTLIIKI